MTAIPTFTDVYNEVKAELESDPDHQFADFGAGSWLDAFAGIVAISGQVVIRWATIRFSTTFVAGSSSTDLDYVALDRYGLTRNTDETDADFKARIALFTANLARGTVDALHYYASSVDGVDTVEVVEDFSTGITDIKVTIEADATAADVLDELRTGLSSWRGASKIVNVLDVTS